MSISIKDYHQLNIQRAIGELGLEESLQVICDAFRQASIFGTNIQGHQMTQGEHQVARAIERSLTKTIEMVHLTGYR